MCETKSTGLTKYIQLLKSYVVPWEPITFWTWPKLRIWIQKFQFHSHKYIFDKFLMEISLATSWQQLLWIYISISWLAHEPISLTIWIQKNSKMITSSKNYPLVIMQQLQIKGVFFFLFFVWGSYYRLWLSSFVCFFF